MRKQRPGLRSLRNRYLLCFHAVWLNVEGAICFLCEDLTFSGCSNVCEGFHPLCNPYSS